MIRRTYFLICICLFLCRITVAGDLPRHLNSEISLEGVISQAPAQHITANYPGMDALYFDPLEGSQTVIYVPNEFDCLERANVTGKVTAVSGGGPDQKSEDKFTEYQLVVSSWRCFGNAEIERRLDLLTDQKQTPEQKAGIQNEIIAEGKAAIPTLIQHLHDERIAWTERVLQNEAQLLNRPPNQPAPKEEWREERIAIGKVVDRLLLRMITPQYESPHQKNFKPFSTRPDAGMFRVEDWRKWWSRARYQSLNSIHEQMKPVVDAYWLSHGVEQVVR